MELLLLFFSSQIKSACKSFANSTDAFSFRIFIGRIFKKMTANTSGLLGIFSGDSDSPQNIFTRGYRFQVIGINTISISAQMVNMGIFFKTFPKQLVRESVSQFTSFCAAYPKLSVSIFKNMGSPKPTRGSFVNLFEKPFINGFSHNRVLTKAVSTVKNGLVR